MERASSIGNETPLTEEELIKELTDRNLAGMHDAMRVLMHERHTAPTYEALLAELNNTRNWNSSGNLEVNCTDKSYGVRVLGTHPDNPHPTNIGVVCFPDTIRDVTHALRQARGEARERMMEALEKERGDDMTQAEEGRQP